MALFGGLKDEFEDDGVMEIARHNNALLQKILAVQAAMAEMYKTVIQKQLNVNATENEAVRKAFEKVDAALEGTKTKAASPATPRAFTIPSSSAAQPSPSQAGSPEPSVDFEVRLDARKEIKAPESPRAEKPASKDRPRTDDECDLNDLLGKK